MPTNHRTPVKNEGEIVLFRSFIQRGLGLPASDFFRGLLYYYGLTLNHLTPNAVLHISIFLNLCEAYLGICPSFTLFRYFFRVKCQPDDLAPLAVGGAGIQLRTKSKKQYLEYDLIDSVKEWARGWFYMVNHHRTGPLLFIPDFHRGNRTSGQIGQPWRSRGNWSHCCSVLRI